MQSVKFFGKVADKIVMPKVMRVFEKAGSAAALIVGTAFADTMANRMFFKETQPKNTEKTPEVQDRDVTKLYNYYNVR